MEICVEIPNTEELSDLQILQLNNIHDQDSECFGVDLFQQAYEWLLPLGVAEVFQGGRVF